MALKTSKFMDDWLTSLVSSTYKTDPYESNIAFSGAYKSYLGASGFIPGPWYDSSSLKPASPPKLPPKAEPEPEPDDGVKRRIKRGGYAPDK